MVIKGQPLYQGNSKSNVINPLIIVEVLSNSTQAYDRGDKFKFYRSLPTFQEYILIEQSRKATFPDYQADNANGTPSFGPKYFYGYGRTYFLNLYINF